MVSTRPPGIDFFCFLQSRLSPAGLGRAHADEAASAPDPSPANQATSIYAGTSNPARQARRGLGCGLVEPPGASARPPRHAEQALSLQAVALAKGSEAIAALRRRFGPLSCGLPGAFLLRRGSEPASPQGHGTARRRGWHGRFAGGETVSRRLRPRWRLRRRLDDVLSRRWRSFGVEVWRYQRVVLHVVVVGAAEEGGTRGSRSQDAESAAQAQAREPERGVG